MYRPALTLTMQNAQTVLDAGLRAIAGGQTVIDLADLTVVDSAAVATLLAWRRAASHTGKTLVFNNPPANLQSLLKLYDVQELLYVAPQAESISRSDLPHH